MDESEKSGGTDQLRQLLLCFQCQRVPFDVISRACEPKSSWSAIGELEQIQPHEGGVPLWLLDLREAHRWPFGHGDDAAAPGLDGLRLINDCGIQYFEIQASPTDGLEADDDEQSQEYASQCIHIFNHAFPCQNTEVLGEEVAARLMPLAKSFLLPFLASVSEREIRHWLLPSESPLHPISFPRKLLNAIDTPTAQGHGAEPCLKVFLEMIEIILTSSLECFERSTLNGTCGGLDERSNAWAGLALGVLISSQKTKRLQPQDLSDAIVKAATSWNPKSTTSPSPIEYLVAIELLPYARLRIISLPEPLRVSMELNLLRGLLLSRMQYHDEAATVLHGTFPAAVSHWGLTSFQVGIIAAESANCYNILRKEDVANTIATRCLAARNTRELASRQDWFYLSLYLADSLIGSGRYAEAESALEHLISQPPITPTIHMMGCLRLSKIRRRVPVENGTAESHHSLHEALGLFGQVPNALREEYLEETACTLEATMATTQGSLEAQEALMNGVNDLLDQTSLAESPAQKRYAQAQLEFKHNTLRQENNTMVPGHAFRRVRSASTEATSQTRSDSSSITYDMTTPTTTPNVFSVPYERDKNYIVVQELESLLQVASPRGGIGVSSIYGDVGVGKTALATEAVYRTRFMFRAVIWIRDAPLDEIFKYLSSVATQLGLKNAEQMYKWFATPGEFGFPGRWLMVFDGIESEEVIRQLWPTGGQTGAVLSVSRRKPSYLNDLASDTPRYTKLGPLNPTNAMILAWGFLNHSAKATFAVNLFKPDASTPRYLLKREYSLAELLEGHPAAIEQAASLISRRDMGIEDFIAGYKKAQASISNLLMGIFPHPNHDIHLIAIWLLNPGDGGPLMNVLSLLDTSAVPESFLWPNASFTRPDGYPQSISEFEEVRNELFGSSLIYRERTQQSLWAHPAVQNIFRERMDRPSFDRAYYRALLLLAHAWPCEYENQLFINDISPHAECSRLWPHVSTLIREPHWPSPYALSAHEATQILKVLLDISWCGIICFMHHQCLNLVEDILEVQATHGLPRETARQMCLLSYYKGVLMYRATRYDQAGLYFRRSFTQVINYLGPGSEDYWSLQAAAHHGVGDVKRRTGDFLGSIDSYDMSIKALEHLKGSPEQELSIVRVHLGLSLLMNGQPEVAESVLEQARLTKSATSIANEIPSSLGNGALFHGLAIAKLAQGKAEESLQFALECLEQMPPLYTSDQKLLACTFHIVVSSSYARLSRVDLAQQHLDLAGAIRLVSHHLPYDKTCLKALQEQKRIF
ncbi:hypothetical protein NCS56_01192200 [Fusarium sp. Ph1]|nr:hypothetical protein NCS56_01192200 [Fusarium sp. Ph1]